MASPFQGMPQSPAELDQFGSVEASLGRRPHLYVVDGEEVEIPDPGNFEPLVDAYVLNRYGHDSRALNIEANQRFLTEQALGKLVTRAFDKVYEREPTLVHDTIMEKQPQSRRIGYAILVEEVSVHLPAPLDAAILRDR